MVSKSFSTYTEFHHPHSQPKGSHFTHTKKYFMFYFLVSSFQRGFAQRVWRRKNTQIHSSSRLTEEDAKTQNRFGDTNIQTSLERTHTHTHTHTHARAKPKQIPRCGSKDINYSDCFGSLFARLQLRLKTYSISPNERAKGIHRLLFSSSFKASFGKHTLPNQRHYATCRSVYGPV